MWSLYLLSCCFMHLIREEHMLGDLEDRVIILDGELGPRTGIEYECTAWLIDKETWYLIPKYDEMIVIKMFHFFKYRLPPRKFKNSSSTETPVGPGRPSRAWVSTDYNLASVSSKGRKFVVRPVLGKRRTDWMLGNTELPRTAEDRPSLQVRLSYPSVEDCMALQSPS